MKNPNIRLIIYSALITVAVVLMLTGIASLKLFGLLLVVLAAHFSFQRRWTGTRRGVTLMFFAAAWAMDFILRWHHGDAFARESTPLWFWVALIACWLWAILSEFQKWRQNRSLT